MHVLADDAVRFRVGVADPANGLWLRNSPSAKTEGRGNRVSGLHLKLRKVDGACVQARRSAGLEPADLEAQPAQRLTQHDGRGLARTPRGVLVLPAVDQAIQESARGDDHGAGFHPASVQQSDAQCAEAISL